MPERTPITLSEPCAFCELELDESAHVAANRWVFVVESSDPKAETHLLVIPRRHIASLNEAPQDILFALLDKLRQVARERGIASAGYRVVVNVGEGGKQKVPHLHLHLLAGPEVLTEGFSGTVE